MPTRYHADRAVRCHRSSPASGGRAVYRADGLEKRNKCSGLHRKSIQYSKGSPWLPKHERVSPRFSSCGGFDDQCRVLVVGTGLPFWRNLYTFGYSSSFRNSLYELQYYRSRAVYNERTQLVSLRSFRNKAFAGLPAVEFLGERNMPKKLATI
jgi:hypothetical protein